MGLWDYLKDIIFSNVRGTFRDIEQDVTIYIERSMNEFKRRMISSLVNVLIFSIAIILIIISIAFALIEYLNLGGALSFLILGVFLLLIGVIVNLINRRR